RPLPSGCPGNRGSHGRGQLLSQWSSGPSLWQPTLAAPARGAEIWVTTKTTPPGRTPLRSALCSTGGSGPLGRLPARVEFGRGQPGRIAPFFHLPDAGLEASHRPAQGLFGSQFELAGEVDRSEEDIAQFVGDVSPLRQSLFQFI